MKDNGALSGRRRWRKRPTATTPLLDDHREDHNEDLHADRLLEVGDIQQRMKIIRLRLARRLALDWKERD